MDEMLSKMNNNYLLKNYLALEKKDENNKE